jgi:hypothetical protein
MNTCLMCEQEVPCFCCILPRDERMPGPELCKFHRFAVFGKGVHTTIGGVGEVGRLIRREKDGRRRR